MKFAINTMAAQREEARRKGCRCMAGATEEKVDHPGLGDTVRGLCRLCSQDSSYLSVHQDASQRVHNPHPVALAHSSDGNPTMSFIGHFFAARFKASSNVMEMCGMPYKAYKPPDDVGELINSTVETVSSHLIRKLSGATR